MYDKCIPSIAPVLGHSPSLQTYPPPHTHTHARMHACTHARTSPCTLNHVPAPPHPDVSRKMSPPSPRATLSIEAEEEGGGEWRMRRVVEEEKEDEGGLQQGWTRTRVGEEEEGG